MRSMWKGSISFGLVTIPVKLYAATESKDVRFNLLHDECRTPIQYRKVCPNCDREVAQEEIVRGYEYEKGRYVIVRDEDLEAIPVAAARTLDIVDFVRLDQIDPIYFDKTYYLEPGEGGAKAYALLRRAMEETGRIAIARVVIRSKESLAAIRVFNNGVLAMETMHFPDEVRSPAGLTGIVAPELRPQELDMATGLIASLSSGDFTPEKFENEYRQAVLDVIAAKAAGEDVVQAAEPVERGRVVDLMEALRASIRQAEEARGAEAGAPATGPAPAAAPAPAPAVPAGVVPLETALGAFDVPAVTPRPAPGVPIVPAVARPAPVPGMGAAPVPGVPGAAPPAVPGPGPGMVPPGAGAGIQPPGVGGRPS